MTHCIDASSLIEAWRRAYPRTAFPGVWRRIEQGVAGGDLISSDEVFREIEQKDDELLDWALAHREAFLPLTEEIQLEAARITNVYDGLVDFEREKSQADPFVIATARVVGAVVVTQERSTGNPLRPKIPDVCRAEGIICRNVLQMILDRGWQFVELPE